MHFAFDLLFSPEKKVSKQGSAVSRGALARHLALFGEISYVSVIPDAPVCR